MRPARCSGTDRWLVLSAGIPPSSRLGLPPDQLAKTIDQISAATQQELADESTVGSREAVPGAGHEIQFDRPQAVIDALEKILDDFSPS